MWKVHVLRMIVSYDNRYDTRLSCIVFLLSIGYVLVARSVTRSGLRLSTDRVDYSTVNDRRYSVLLSLLIVSLSAARALACYVFGTIMEQWHRQQHMEVSA